MSKKYRTKTNRSRRKPSVGLRGRITQANEKTIELSLPVAEILLGVRNSVEHLATEAGLLVMSALIEDEVEQLVGERYNHVAERGASRWGFEEGYVAFAGRKVPMKRPRVRNAEGEVPLKRYEMFQNEENLEEGVSKRVVRGVATRNYEGVIDDLCDGYGIRKSSVSRRWKALSQKKLDEMMARPLSEVALQAIMIDGIEFQNYLVIVALGIDATGKKHVLGLWPGATENSEVCKALLADLIDRGLPTSKNLLFVLDGSKALAKAVRSCFGKRALIQRCQFHKERNVLSYLPPEYHAGIRQRLRTAWGMVDHDEAKKLLEKTILYIDDISHAAANSLREGLEETLTVHRLEVPDKLRKTLKSTNPIESLFSSSRELVKNVKRWQNENMVVRWAGAMLLEAEKKFRRLKGFREMPKLVATLNPLEDTANSVA